MREWLWSQSEFWGVIYDTFLIAQLWMLFVWSEHLYFKRDLSRVDFAWASLFLILSIYFAIAFPLKSVWLMTSLYIIWSLRLSIHLWPRRNHSDVRYAAVSKHWVKKSYSKKSLEIFVLQGIIAWFLAMPLLILVLNAQENLHQGLYIFGLIGSTIGILGEALSDRQLQKHMRRHPEKVCRSGFWAYSRHPNYFFNFLFWCGLAVAVFSLPWGWMAIFCPVFMFLTFWFWTGIPPTEKVMKKRFGEDYRHYQDEVSRFLPLPPGRVASKKSNT